MYNTVFSATSFCFGFASAIYMLIVINIVAYNNGYSDDDDDE